MRRLGIGLGVLAAVLVAGILGLNLWVHSYLRSEAFRRLIAARTGQALQADADCQPLDWSGSSVFSASLTARGEAGGPLESLDAEQVRANVDWRAIFDGAWRVDRMDIVRLDVKIRTEPQRAAGGPGPTPGAAPPKRGLLPNRFELDRVSVQDANVAVGALGRIRNTALTVQPEGDGWIFDGSGGWLEISGRQPLEVDSVRVRLQQGVVYLTNAAMRLGANGSVTVSGEVGGPHAPFDMRTQWQNVDAADVLDAAWKGRLTGALSGLAECAGRPGRDPITTGNFLLTDGHLEGLPVQREIAHFTRSPEFERMPLSAVSGDFTTDGAATTVKNFVAESPGLLRVEGGCHIGADGSMDGAFQVGVTSQTLQWLPGSQEKVFLTARGGYLWTDVKIGGTVGQPTEDLSGRLARAMGEQVIETGAQLIERTPSNATDAVKKAVDLLSPLIP
ncbi:MAG: hypothetical protein PHC88_12035 [Terrimicrobiaceae bacterium]|nr:hypothetical protein [Terrimicrobiaceae bacterium]